MFSRAAAAGPGEAVVVEGPAAAVVPAVQAAAVAAAVVAVTEPITRSPPSARGKAATEGMDPRAGTVVGASAAATGAAEAQAATVEEVGERSVSPCRVF